MGAAGGGAVTAEELASAVILCRAVFLISCGLNLPVSSSGFRVSALSNGVTDRLVSASAPEPRPRCGSFGRVAVFLWLELGDENKAKNINPNTTVDPASRRNAFVRSSRNCSRLILARASPCGERCIAWRIWAAQPSGSGDGSAGVASFPSETGAGSSGFLMRRVAVWSCCSSGFSSRTVSSGFIGRSSSNAADAKANRSQRRQVDGARIGNLEKQRFVRLFEARPVEDYHAIGSLARSKAPSAQAKIDDAKLFGRGPLVLDLPAQLNLRRQDLNGVPRRV